MTTQRDSADNSSSQPIPKQPNDADWDTHELPGGRTLRTRRGPFGPPTPRSSALHLSFVPAEIDWLKREPQPDDFEPTGYQQLKPGPTG